MPPRDWKMRIRDILDSIKAIREYTAGMGFETFSGDQKTMDAVIRNITIIGEAARNVPEEITNRYSNIPWEDMRGMRNIVVHVYFGVRKEILWDTIQDDLPPLVGLLRQLLDEEK